MTPRHHRFRRERLLGGEELVPGPGLGRGEDESAQAREILDLLDLRARILVGFAAETGSLTLRVFVDTRAASVSSSDLAPDTIERLAGDAVALARLTESYYAMGLTSEAQTAAAVLGQNYPDSQWYKDSYTLLQTGGLEPRDNAGSWISKAGKLITGA